MPQIARFPENLTGAELLAMLRTLRGDGQTANDELVARFRLENELTKPLRTLSGGTRQKVNAVMAFLFEPKLLILDEPTAGLDPIASGVLKDAVLSARRTGRTFILTSHILSEIEEMADDIVFLLEGRVRFAGSVHELSAQTGQHRLERAIAQLMREMTLVTDREAA
jgi:Cu-processing system ATP-binding protein